MGERRQIVVGHGTAVTVSARKSRGRAASSVAMATAMVLALACLVVVSLGGCSTSYQPRSTGRVGLVIYRASALYVKDGRRYPIGPFSGDLESLVVKSPEAVTHARIAHNRFAVGVPSYLVGAGTVITGVAFLSGPVGWVVIGIGASAIGTGLGFLGVGFTHLVDAINTHNDAVTP